MKKVLPLAAALALPLFASSAHAAATDYAPLSSLYAWQTVVDVWANQTHPCGGDNNKFTLRMANGGFETMHSQLLASLLSGRKVRLTYACEGGLAVIGGVQLGQ